jgi:hypothetical protein
MWRVTRACCLLVIASLYCGANYSLAYDPIYENVNLFSNELNQAGKPVLSIPGLGTFSLQEVLQQGESGDDMVYIARTPQNTAAPAAQQAPAVVPGDSLLEPELSPAAADILALLHRSLQQQEQEAPMTETPYPGAAAVSSLTESWIESTL